MLSPTTSPGVSSDPQRRVELGSNARDSSIRRRQSPASRRRPTAGAPPAGGRARRTSDRCRTWPGPRGRSRPDRRTTARRPLGLAVEQVLDEHAEGRAPVAHVVVPDHPMARPVQQPDDGIADDGAAQVADVHLLGDIGRRVVDHDGLGRFHQRHPKPCVVAHGRDLACQVVGT